MMFDLMFSNDNFLWRRIGRGMRMGAILAYMTVASCVLTSSAHGQVVFSSKTRPVNFRGYSSVWDCLAAIQRIRDSISDANAIWRDTFPIEMVPHDSMPPTVIRVARECGVDVTDADPRKDMRQWVRLILLRSGPDALTDVIQYFAPVLTASDSVRQGIINAVATEYTEDPLLVLPEIDRWREVLVQRVNPPRTKATLWKSYIHAAQERQDTQRAEHALRELLAVGLDTTTADGENLRLVHGARRGKDLRQLLDSLRTGGSASYLRAFASSAVFEENFGAREMVGKEAPMLNVPVWIPARPDGQVPAAGKTTMLVFVDNQSFVDKNGRNREPHGSFAALRRISERFPELDIVFVTRTLGWFGEGPPLSVTEEGAAIGKWLFEHHRLRGRLAVDSTPFYRMPDPDRRRVYLESEIDQSYRLGRTGRYTRWKPDELKGGPLVVLVNANRTIIECGRISNFTEPRFATFIEVLLKENTH